MQSVSSRECLENYYALRKQLAEKNEEVLDLSMINPDIPPPRYAVDRLLEAAFSLKNHRYAVSRGILKAREGIAAKYCNSFNVNLNPGTECCITFGTKDAVLNTLQCLLRQGDRVLVGSPAYSPYVNAINFLGLNAVFFQTSSDENIMLESIGEVLGRHAGSANPVKLLLLNFPNNPTGIRISKKFVQKIHELKEKHNFFVFNDFAYGEMSFSEQAACSFLADHHSQKGIVESYTLSKAYSLPGWRFAGVAGDQSIIEKISLMKSKMDYGLFLPIQIASSMVLKSTEGLALPIAQEYSRRIKTVVSSIYEAFNSKNFGYDASSAGRERIITEPEAGCSVWFKLPEPVAQVFPKGDFCYTLLKEKKLALTPGHTYGEAYKDYIRIAMVANDSLLRTAVDKIVDLSRKSILAGSMIIALIAGGEHYCYSEEDCIQSSKLIKQGTQIGSSSGNPQSNEEIELYEKAIKLCPSMAEAYHNLGVAKSRRGDIDSGLALIKKAVELKEDPRFLLSQAGLLLKKSQISEAEVIYDNIISRDTQNIRALQGKAVTLEKQGKYDEAVTFLKKALILSSNDVITHYNLAALYDRQSKLDLALQHYKETLSIKPDHNDAKYHLGIVLWKRGNNNDAKNLLEQALTISPDDTKIIRVLGFVYEALGDLDKSELSFRKVLSSNSGDIPARVSLGTILLNKKQYTAAIEEEKKAIEIEPNNGKAYTVLGIAYIQSNDYLSAEAALRKATEYDSSNASAHYNLGVAQERLGKTKEAENSFKIAEQLDPSLVTE